MRKRILIALAVVVALPLLAVAALFAIRETPDGPRVEAEAGVVGIEAGGAYAWIVRTPHGAVLVDAGLDAQGVALVAELKAEGVQPDQVQAVLITHGHPDHYAAATLFPKAKILVGHSDIAMIRGDTSHYAAFGKLMSTLLTMPPGPPEMTEVRGGEELEFDGARFQVIAAPGHSPGIEHRRPRERRTAAGIELHVPAAACPRRCRRPSPRVHARGPWRAAAPPRAR